MPRNVITQGETIEDLHNLTTSMAAYSGEFPHLEGPRGLLDGIIGEARNLITLQANLAGQRQEASKRLRELLTEGRRLGNFLRVGLKQHYGPRSEKLATFKIQPFRGLKRAKPEEPPAPAASTPEIP